MILLTVWIGLKWCYPIPILAQIAPQFNPAWASVGIALAATALGLDRFFGFSTAWMRFITSELKLQARLQAFQFDWEYERVSWQGKAPDYEQTRVMILQCAGFATEVSTLVQEETQTWVEEFQSA